LLDAGLELFGTIGYAGTSLTALCAAASVSPRHFYELYRGREQLIADLYDELVAEMGTLIAAAQDSVPLSVQARISAGLRAAVDFQAGDPRRARVLQLEVVGVSTWLESHRHAVIASFGQRTDVQYRLLVADGQLVDAPFERVATALIGAINELLIGWLLSEPRPPADELLPVAEEIFLAVFRSRAVAGR
jgi:AcrR family transcriptional regulator